MGLLASLNEALAELQLVGLKVTSYDIWLLDGGFQSIEALC